MIQRWIAGWPSKKVVAVADQVFLSAELGPVKAELDELRKNRKTGLRWLAGISLTGLPTLLGAAAWGSGDVAVQRALAQSAIFFAGSFGVAAIGVFLDWFEPMLRRRAPSKRFVIGPDDIGDQDEQASEYWARDWVEENGHTLIPAAITWRVVAALLWVALLLSAALFVTALLMGGVGLVDASSPSPISKH